MVKKRIYVSDLHLSSNNFQNIWDRILTFASWKGIKNIVIMGDMINYSYHQGNEKRYLSLFSKLNEMFKKEGIEAIYICGNHDYFSKDSVDSLQYTESMISKFSNIKTDIQDLQSENYNVLKWCHTAPFSGRNERMAEEEFLEALSKMENNINLKKKNILLSHIQFLLPEEKEFRQEECHKSDTLESLRDNYNFSWLDKTIYGHIHDDMQQEFRRSYNVSSQVDKGSISISIINDNFDILEKEIIKI